MDEVVDEVVDEAAEEIKSEAATEEAAVAKDAVAAVAEWWWPVAAWWWLVAEQHLVLILLVVLEHRQDAVEQLHLARRLDEDLVHRLVASVRVERPLEEVTGGGRGRTWCPRP